MLHPPLINYEELAILTNVRRDKDIVLTISRFSSDRGLDRVLYIAKKIPRARFVIAGFVQDSRYFQHIYLSKPPNVYLFPNVDERMKRLLLAKAKIYLNPTPHIEGFGGAVVEAMAAGLIPVVTDKGGLKDFVPKCWRAKNLEELVIKVENGLNKWNIGVAKTMSKLAEPFSYNNFRAKLFQILKNQL